MEVHLILEDCITGMAKMDENSVDTVVTSPPYNLGKKYSSYVDKLSDEEYFDWSKKWTSQVKRLLKQDGSFFLNLGATPHNPLFPHKIAILLCEEFHLQNTFHWIKSISVNKNDGDILSLGHFKPINSKRYITDCHEFIFHFTKSGNVNLNRLSIGVPYADKSNINRWKHTDGKDLRCRGNNWYIPYPTIQNKWLDRPHPATFPTKLAENCLKIHGFSPELVILDPFLGIGHSLLAAKKCGAKHFYGFEIDEAYLSVAHKMFKNKQFKQQTFEGEAFIGI